MAVNNQQGFTLIELMVTVTILGILCAMAAPFTGQWVDKNHVSQASSQLSEAYGRAKAAALRNRQAVLQGNAASLVCIDTAKLSIHEGMEGVASAKCTTTATWTAAIPKNVSIRDATGPVSCIAFDNRGLQIKPDDSACSDQTLLTLSRGSANDQISLN
nr:prepilin-type N-terminal cleavage/methylation domain-containing protein [Pseudomonas fluorescens]